MTKDFNDWWNSDLPLTNNPYTEDTPAYWAWAGWVAGAKAEREAILKLTDSLGWVNADHIRARGEV